MTFNPYNPIETYKYSLFEINKDGKEILRASSNILKHVREDAKNIKNANNKVVILKRLKSF